MISPEQLGALKNLYPEILLGEEGGAELLLIKDIRLPKDCDPAIVSALLCPAPRDGYESRLFLDTKIVHKGQGQNWNPNTGSVILGKQWWAVSWKTAKGQTLLQMLLDHLRAFQS